MLELQGVLDKGGDEKRLDASLDLEMCNRYL